MYAHTQIYVLRIRNLIHIYYPYSTYTLYEVPMLYISTEYLCMYVCMYMYMFVLDGSPHLHFNSVRFNFSSSYALLS